LISQSRGLGDVYKRQINTVSVFNYTPMLRIY
jgi:hypothetical protein